MKLAIVHDFLNQYGGAERVVETLHEVFPDAPIYTSIFLPRNMPDTFKEMDIRTSFMQKLPFLDKHFRKYFLVYPLAFRSFDFSGYDLILSSSSAYAKGIKVPKGVLHICYCYTPARFIWRYDQYIEKEKASMMVKRIISFLTTSLLKKWDITTSKNVDYFIAICENIKNRIEMAYNRDSEVIYPPVETSKFSISDKIEDYFLVVSRLNAYKRIDIVIEAFNKLKIPLRIIGDGPHRKYLQNLAGPNIEFLGKLSAKDLNESYNRCQALIFPGEEDFGIVPVEAQACRRPVIAYAAGGALETVIEGVSGVFFKEQTVEALSEAIKKFDRIKDSLAPKKIREEAIRFDKEIFKKKIKAFIEEKHKEQTRC